MKKKPIISIITPNFNRETIFQETIASIQKQTYSNWEHIIVDDGSTDNSWDFLENYSNNEPRAKVFKRNREPKGAATCRNIAVEKSSGKYLLFLDTDDLLAEHCLEQRLNAINEYPECDFLIFPMLLFKKKIDDLNLLWNIDSKEDDLSRFFRADPVCQGTGTLWKKDSFLKVGLWDESLYLWQDIDLHIQSLLKGVIYKKRLDLVPDVYIRVSEVSLSRTNYYSPKKLESRFRVFSKALKLLERREMNLTLRNSVRAMAKSILSNALNIRYFAIVTRVIEVVIVNNILSQNEIRKLKRIVLFQKMRLNKISFFSKKKDKFIQSLSLDIPSNMGKVSYKEVGKA